MEFKEFLSSLAEYENSAADNSFSKRSDLWQFILEPRTDVIHRTYEENLEVFQNFLSADSCQTSGVSDWNTSIEPLLLELLSSKIDLDYLIKYPASDIGNPKMFELGGQQLNMPHAWNLMTFQLLSKLLEEKAYKTSKFDFVEIGAGFGSAASMWIKQGRVNSYTIIDLVDNLPNSFFYLKSTLPEWKMNLISSQSKFLPESNTITFLTPSHIGALQAAKFEIALNTDSLGEMPKSTAQEYISWIDEHLVQGGLFFSKNGHLRSAGNISQLSEYGYDRFKLRHFGFADYFSSIFDDFSHVVVLEKGRGEWSAHQLKYADTLAHTLRCGLNTDIEELIQRFSDGNLSHADLDLLEGMRRYFERGILGFNADDELTNLVFCYFVMLKYLAGEVAKSAAVNAVSTVLKIGIGDVVRIYGYIALLKMGGDPSEYKLKDENACVRYYVSKLVLQLGNNPLKKHLVFRIRSENIWKKIHPQNRYKPSNVMKLKNLVLNVKEGRGFKLSRG